MAKRPFPVDPVLTAIAIAYHNRRMIADEVMHRINPLAKDEFKYTKFELSEGFTVPDTAVGRRSAPNELSFSGTEETESTKDYGLDDPIPQSDIANADERFNPVNRSVEQLTNVIALGREVRVAQLTFSADNYAASNVKAMAAGSRFSDHGHDVLGELEEMLETPVMRPNVLTFGQATWSAFRRHPKVVKAAHANSGDSGLASRERVAELLEVEKLLVGEARINTAKKGQAAKLEKAWGNSVAGHFQDVMADNRSGTTWGFTAQYGQHIAGSWEDKNIGLRGGTRVRVGESVKEVVSAKDLGFLLNTVTA